MEFGHYEVYTFTSGTNVTDGTAGVGQAFEFNYGVIPDGQFPCVLPAFNVPADGPAFLGLGDTELGFSTVSFRKTRTVGGRWSASFQCSKCRREI